MAKRRRSRRSRRYRMTPARRAALKKAQLASARKRRRNARNAKIKSVARSSAKVGVAIGAAFLQYHGRRYLYEPTLAVKHAKIVHKKAKSYRDSLRSSGPNRKPPNVLNNSPEQLRLF